MLDMEDRSPVICGCDHGGYSMKEHVKAHLLRTGIAVEDVGTFSEEAVDYPDFAIKVARAVSSGLFRRGILVCGTGLGMSIVANRFPGVRATLCNDLFSAIMGRRHNNSNVLVMGGRVVGLALATEIVKAWLETPFDGGRHQGRLDKLDVNFSNTEGSFVGTGTH